MRKIRRLLFCGRSRLTGEMNSGRDVLQWLVVFLVLFWCELPGVGWDAGGHEVIAMLAWEHLNPKARQAVTELAREIPTDGLPYDSVTMACWMDDLRRRDPALPDEGLFLTWHYIDLGIEPSDPMPSLQPGDDNEFHGNVVQALERARVVLEGGTDPYIKTRAMACAMAMHLVGDIHQPLHAATHYFQTAGGWTHHDAGGNKEYVMNGPEGEARFSLVLDDRYQERGAHDPVALQGLVKVLSGESAGVGVNLQPDFAKWAWESHAIAENFVYPGIMTTESKKYCRLSSGYVVRAKALARQQIVLAADRLAVLLNETLGAATPGKPPESYPAGPPGRPYGSGF